jgi:membrane-associated phospholipid phosphatase
MKRFIAIIILVGASMVSKAEINLTADSTKHDRRTVYGNYIYQRPKPLAFLAKIPSDYVDYSKQTFTRKNLPTIGAMVAGTALLVVADQYILNQAQSFGDDVHLQHTSHQYTVFNPSVKLGENSIRLPISLPSDVSSGLYFLGDGITHFTIAGAFWVTGLIRKDNRALQTSSQLLEAILASGVAVQTLKHITGRQSPYTSTENSGLWRVFPNQKDYANGTPNYDAFPSGHLASAMATVTVIADNYPEYKFIRPVGYSLMGLLGFAMLNNGVHWASDYPLGLALGYGFAKIAVSKGRTLVKPVGAVLDKKNYYGIQSIKTSPTMMFNGTMGFSITAKL